MATKYPKVLVDGKWIDARYSEHPNYQKERDTVSNRKPIELPPSPAGIGRENWQRIQEWIPTQVEQGLPIGRTELAKAIGVQETTINSRHWVRIIYEAYPNLFEWEPDPLHHDYHKRGRVIQRLKVKSR